MTIPAENLKKFKIDPALSNLEWYDNSTLSMIDSCHRLGFYQKVLTIPNSPHNGISFGANHGMRFGTCMHSGLAALYAGIKAGHTRRAAMLNACRRLSATHKKVFPEPNDIDPKHSLARALSVLDLYTEYYSHDDIGYIPVDIEISAVRVMKPIPGDVIDFEPFLWVSRSDALFLRLFDQTHWIFETKTTGGSVQQEVDQLRIGRQPQGYAWTFNNEKWLPKGIRIKGVLANVLGVRVAETDGEKLFKREPFTYNEEDMMLWRLETIEKVQRWRDICTRAKNAPTLIHKLAIFDRRTEQCFRWGRCPAYDLCEWGLQYINWNKMIPNTWNPLMAED